MSDQFPLEPIYDQLVREYGAANQLPESQPDDQPATEEPSA